MDAIFIAFLFIYLFIRLVRYQTVRATIPNSCAKKIKKDKDTIRPLLYLATMKALLEGTSKASKTLPHKTKLNNTF